jgi:hypothetical protein
VIIYRDRKTPVRNILRTVPSVVISLRMLTPEYRFYEDGDQATLVECDTRHFLDVVKKSDIQLATERKDEGARRGGRGGGEEDNAALTLHFHYTRPKTFVWRGLEALGS